MIKPLSGTGTPSENTSTMDRTGVSFYESPTEYPLPDGQQSMRSIVAKRKLESGSPKQLDDVRRFLVRICDTIDAVISEGPDPLAIDTALEDAKSYWQLAFAQRKALSPEARGFLRSLFVPLSSNIAANDVGALKTLCGVIREFSVTLGGCDDKDITRWRETLATVGFDFSEPISA